MEQEPLASRQLHMLINALGAETFAAAMAKTTALIEQRMPRRVVCAAIRIVTGEGQDYVVVLGVRHCDAYMLAQCKTLGIKCVGLQGFVDQRGHFMTRSEAWLVAQAAGQIVRRVGGDGTELYSENLY